MARIKGITESDANNDEVRKIIEDQKKRHGFISNAVQVSAVRPTIYKGVQALAQGIQETGPGLKRGQVLQSYTIVIQHMTPSPRNCTFSF